VVLTALWFKHEAQLEQESGELRAGNRALLTRTEVQAADPAPEPPLLFLRRRWLWIAVLVAFVAAIVLLTAWLQ